MALAESCRVCGTTYSPGLPDGATCPSCAESIVHATAPTIEDYRSAPSVDENDHGGVPTVDGYRILKILGQGGMGIVYLAEQESPIRRLVALKMIKRGFDTGQIIARFRSERQALAHMSHPGVAHVYDAGSTLDGRPFFVMEFVDGLPITAYCDEKRLDVKERLMLFTSVCEALHHAHLRGIVHRDIKPSNVLVTLQDGVSVIKIIDFGVAKATRGDPRDETLHTEVGALIGTPAYMSPEQIGVPGLEPDARTDVYALGVMLYELLVGAHPLDLESLKARGAGELLRAIREDDPPALVARLRSMGSSAAESASLRGLDPSTHRRLLSGELEWITQRSLHKEPGRRYASALELQEDIRRYLAGEAVHAGPVRISYRAKRWLARHRGPVLAMSVILALAVSSIASGLFLSSRARQAELRELTTLIDRIASEGEIPFEAEAGQRDKLAHRLRDELDVDPFSPLVLRAQRAAAQLAIDVTPFALRSTPPLITVRDFGKTGIEKWLFPDGLPDEARLAWTATFEASWDGSPWRSIERLAAAWTGSGNVIVPGQPLDRVVPEGAWRSGPHRLEIRATLKGYPLDVVLPAEDHTVFPDEHQPPLYKETVPVLSTAVSVFDEFPPDFPRPITLHGSISERFQIHRCELLSVEDPDSVATECLEAPWPGHEPDHTTTCLMAAHRAVQDLLVGFKIEGRITLPDDVPLAMKTVLTCPGSAEPTLEFDLAPGSIYDVGLNGDWWVSWGSSVDREGEDISITLLEGRFLGSRATRAWSTRSLPRDDAVSCQLRFVPSRDVALATRRTDRYLGNEVTIPVTVTNSVVRARRSQATRPWYARGEGR